MIDSWIQFLKQHRWWSFAGLVGLLCIYAFIQEIIPQTIGIAYMRKSIRENEARVAQVDEWDWTIQRMEKKKEKLHQQIENLVYSQQQKNQFSSIYAFLSQNARKYNVSILNIKPGEPEPGNRYIRLPIALRLNTDYHALGKYINALETSDPIIQVASWSMEAEEITSHELNASLVIWVYFLT